MSSRRHQPDPRPKNGRFFKVLAVCRISTDHQSEMSLDDQLALYREWLDQWLDGDYEIEIVSSRGSGELLDRQELFDISDKIGSGLLDIVIAEDLGRIARRLMAMQICEEAKDSKTRLIAINDQVDTFEDGWRQNAFFATMRHESYNRDTSNRIRRSQRNRFATGDMVHQLPAGYVKPHPGATEAECYKAPGAEEVYDEWFVRLERGETFAEVADWLNTIDFPTGMGATKEEWDGTLVGQTTRNSILKGVREHNRRTSVRINRTGRRRSVAAPSELLMQRHCPHLAFIDPERYDRVLRMIDLRNARYRNGIAEANGARSRGTRNDSRWPSQHIRCGICGRKFVLGGHGRKDRMMCDGARTYQCWNAMTIDQAEVACAVAAEICKQIELLPDFDDELIRQIQSEANALVIRLNESLTNLHAEYDRVQREVDNLTNAIANGLSSSAVLSRLAGGESELQSISDRICEINENAPAPIAIPSADQIRQIARNTFLELAVDSPEFGRVMREIVDEFYVLPYRLIDGGMIAPRCLFRLNFNALNGVEIPDRLQCTGLNCSVDLTRPPQRVQFRSQVISLREGGMTEREVATQLGITHTAAQRAAKLDREMRRRGIIDPWQPVRCGSDAADCFKRIQNPRYRFDPLSGFVPKFPDLES